ncbi:hypothetical protein Patl1_04419 [Pistacia atlantica]|uniref:Uncharacterized protein n=1 Tax=Pistacia atlantica TaxID=434234 RepID=A0ACC1BRU9_9ROSI|nr:hypothetical protein Patl1_04419 [Pistacia atlantica]
MSLSIVSAAATSVENTAKEETNRRSANFRPTIWGDHFLSYATESMETDHYPRLLELKEEIRKLIIANVKKPAEKLDLIDAIQRWDASAMDQLPGYMKLCYQALLDVYSETEKDMADQGRLYSLHFAKEAFPLLDRILNLSRVIDVIYKDEDGYTLAHVMLKDSVTSLLINPVPL